MSASTHLDPSRIIALVVALSSTAYAEPAVSWRAPEGCPDETSVRAQIAHRLGESRERAIRVEVEHAVDGDGFVALVSLDGATSRTLTAATCDELVAAVALIVARTADDATEPPPAMPPPAPPAVDAAASAIAPAATSTAWNLGVRLAAVSAIDVVPGVGLGSELSIYVEHGAASAEAGGAYWATRSMALMSEGLDLGHIDVGLLTAVGRVGYRLGAFPLRVVAVAELGSMTGTADRSAAGLWFAAGGGIRAWWQAAARLRVVAGLESELARDRVRFVMADGTLEYEPGQWSVRGSVGLEVSVW